MPVRTDLTLIEGNTETVKETVTDDDTGLPLNLSGKTVEFYIKADATVPDSDPSVVKLSTATSGVTITDAANGICQAAIPAQTAGVYWRRLDVVSGSDRKTAIYGPLYVINV
jgi:hypothetical protein